MYSPIQRTRFSHPLLISPSSVFSSSIQPIFFLYFSWYSILIKCSMLTSSPQQIPSPISQYCQYLAPNLSLPLLSPYFQGHSFEMPAHIRWNWIRAKHCCCCGVPIFCGYVCLKRHFINPSSNRLNKGMSFSLLTSSSTDFWSLVCLWRDRRSCSDMPATLAILSKTIPNVSNFMELHLFRYSKFSLYLNRY